MHHQQFDFGKNWIAFSQHRVTKERYAAARNDLHHLLGELSLAGRSFLDIGFGQGLSILAAAEDGATTTGCDINPRCTEALSISAAALGRTPPERIITGSILEEETADQLRNIAPDGFDVVHSWGVLHHTGNMAKAIENSASLVTDGGYLVIAIYNRHWSSPLWHGIKMVYNRSPSIIRHAFITLFFPVIAAAKFIVTRKNPFQQDRGMDFRFDVIDWIGGFPYEYASVNEIISTVEKLGFTCIRLQHAGVPTGCNQFVFKKNGTRKDL